MIGLAITMVLIMVVVWILFAPLIIRIDTIENTCDLRLPGLFKTWLSIDQEGLAVHVWFPFYRFKMDPLRRKAPKKRRKRKATASEKKKVMKRPNTKLMRRLLNTMYSFRIIVFEASLDTDNYLLNAQLVPLCQLIRRHGLAMNINFQGNSYFRLEVRNNLYRLGLAYLEIKKYS